MIVDCHTQIWDATAVGSRVGVAVVQQAHQLDAARVLEAVDTVDRAIVLGFKSCYLSAGVSNRDVAEYVRRHSSKMVGFAGIDPTDIDWLEELRVAQEELRLKGVTICPSMQNFHPCDTRAMRLFEECARRGMPIVIEQFFRNPAAKLEFARPALLDEIAREFPQLRIVIAHLGFPYIHETLVMLDKHPNVFADIAGLLRQQWLTYNALLSAYEYGVMEKLLFGSDFPYRSPAACIEALYSINQISHGTNLATIPREQLRGIVERDALALLGIEERTPPALRSPTRTLGDDD